MAYILALTTLHINAIIISSHLMWLLFVIVVFTEAGINPLSPPGNASAVAVYVMSLTTVDIKSFWNK